MTPFDDELARALARVPVGEYAPLERLHGRARQLQVRRRLAGTGIALAAVLAVAVPSALAFGDGDVFTPAPPAGGTPGPFPTDDFPTHCPVTYGDRLDAMPTYPPPVWLAGPDALPAPVRLLWDENVAPAPTTAYGADYSPETDAVADAYAMCPAAWDRSVMVVQSAGGVVERTALVEEMGERSDIGGDDAEGEVRTLDAGSTRIRIDVTHSQIGAGFRAEWEDAEGITWQVGASELTDDEMVDLVESMVTEGDDVDVSDWSFARDAEQVLHRTGVADGYGAHSFNALTDSPELHLSVNDDNATRWLSASPGTQEVDVAGKPGLLSQDDDGSWLLS